MKYFAEILETTGETPAYYCVEITSYNVSEAKTALLSHEASFSGKTYKEYIHSCGNTSSGRNISCKRTEI